MTFTCPMCGHPLDPEPHADAGDPAVCPACGTPLEEGRQDFASREAALRKVQSPAIFLIVVGVLMIFGGCVGATSLALESANPGGQAPPPERVAPREEEAGELIGQFAGIVIGPLFGIAVILGGIKMYRLESYGSVKLASVLAMLPCSACCVFGLPIGIWSLVVLNDPTVKASFR